MLLAGYVALHSTTITIQGTDTYLPCAVVLSPIPVSDAVGVIVASLVVILQKVPFQPLKHSQTSGPTHSPLPLQSW